ncbi:hypothetical protein [Levilactobacillus sp. HBUAS70063]|uniref:hypothetical protein n=1 Tax=Levilactobacillus sp. HBUAS70063 TaxID=3109359 RepID=UPI00313315F8
MPTNKEVCQALKATKVGLSLPDENGEQQPLYLSDCGSILTFIKLPDNADIKAKLKEKSAKITPNNIDRLMEINLSVDASVFTDPKKQNLPFKSDYIFLALNVAERKADQRVTSEWGQFHDTSIKTPMYKLAFMTNHERFRGSYITDILKNTVNSRSANIEADYFVEKDSRFPGLFLDESETNVRSLAKQAYPSYVNRYKKGSITHSTDKFVENAHEYEQVVRRNQEKYRQSAKLFIKECQIIQPKQLIVLGRKAQKVVRNMRADGLFDERPGVIGLVDNLIEAQHYSNQGRGTSTEDFMNYLQELLKKTE